MKIAKIIRHRHRFEHYLNEVIRGVEEEVHYKVVFSDLKETNNFHKWVNDNKGMYLWNKDENKVMEDSKLPNLEGFDENEVCWCDVISHFLLNVANYNLHCISSPYKMEVYVKE